jgi:5,10-methylenetetrahydromethanopterin reductase
MSDASGIGIAIQLTDVVRHRSIDGKDYVASVGDAKELVDFAQQLNSHFSRLWLTDNLGYRNTIALLGALAATTDALDLGTFTAFPYGRDPIDTASALATVREMMPGRDLAFGLSRGSRAVTDLHHAEYPLRLLKEYVNTVRALLAGTTVEVDDVPELARTHALRAGTRMKLHTDPIYIPILMASTGHRTLRLAGAIGDGVQFVTQQPTQSASLLGQPDFAERSGLSEVAAGRETNTIQREFRQVYGISVSVASDPLDAVNFARRQVAGVLSTKEESQLAAVGIDPAIAREVREVLRNGSGLAEASRRVPTDLVRQLIATGTPDEVAEQVARSIDRSRGWGFDEHFICFPLGPDVRDAVGTIVSHVLPALK